MTVVVDIQGNSRPIEGSIANIARRLQSLEAQAGKTGKATSFSSKPVVDTAAAVRELKVLNATAAGVSNTINGIKNSLLFAFAAGSTALGIAALNSQLNGLIDTSINLSNQLKLVTNSSEELFAIQKKLQGQARNSYSDLESTASSYVKISKALKGTGKSQDDILKLTETLSKAAASSGSSAETIKASMYQLQQGISSGVLRGEELNSVYEGIRPVAAIFEEFLGVTSGELRELAADGKLTTDVIVKSLEAGFYDVEEVFLRTTRTIGSAKQAVTDASLLKVGEIDALLGISQRKIETYLKIADFINSVDVTSRPDLGKLKEGKKDDSGTQQTQQQLTVFEKAKLVFEDLATAVEYTSVIFTGSFKVFGAVLSRLSDYLPSIRLVERTLGTELARGAKTAIVGAAQSVRSTFRTAFLNVFQFNGYGIQESINDLFKAESPEELAAAFDELAYRISNYGKSWFNVYRNVSTYFLGIRNSTQDMLMKLGLMDQKLILIRRRTTDSFSTITKLAGQIATGLGKELSNMPLLVTIYDLLGQLKDILSVVKNTIAENLSDSLSDTLSGIQEYASSVLGKVQTTFSNFFNFIKDGFYDVYIDVVGNSTWPDLLDGIVAYTNAILPVVIGKFQEFYGKLQGIFNKMSSKGLKVDLSAQLDPKALLSSIGDVVRTFYSALRDAFPLLATYISAAIAGAVTFALDDSFAGSIKNFLKLGIAGAAGEFLLELLGGLGTLELVARDVGTLLGQSAGAFVALIIRNIPDIAVALLEAVKAFGNAFLGELGIIGNAIRALGKITGTDGLLGAVIFGAGLPILLGKFDKIKGALSAILTLFSGSSVFGVGQNKKGKQDGIIGYLLLGEGRGLLGYLSLFTAVWSAFQGDLSSAITTTGLAALLFFGPSGSIKIIMSALSVLASAFGITGKVGAVSFKGVTAAAIALGTSLLNIGKVTSFSRLGTFLTVISGRIANLGTELYAALAPLGSSILASILPAMTTVFAAFRGLAARAVVFGRAVGGALGAIGSTLFGKLGIAAILAAITLVFSGAANAGTGAEGMMAGLGWADYGLIGVMLFGTMGIQALGKLAGYATKKIAGDALKAAALSSAIDGAVVGSIGGAIIAALKRVVLAVVSYIAGIPALIIAAFVAVVASLGYLVYKAYDWFTTTKAEKEAREKLQALQDLADKTQGELEAVFEKENIKNILSDAKVKLDIEAFLDTTILSGASEETLKDISLNTVALSEAVDAANETLKTEGVSTRAEILAVREAVKDLKKSTEDAGLDAYRKQAAGDLKTQILDSLALAGELPKQAIDNGRAGFTGDLLNLDASQYTQDTRILLGLLKDLEISLPKATADPASAIKYFKTVEQLSNAINKKLSANTGFFSSLFPTDIATIDQEVQGLTLSALALKDTFERGVTTEGLGEAFEKRLRKLSDDAEALQLSGLDFDELSLLPEEVLGPLEESIKAFQDKYGNVISETLDTEGLDRATKAVPLAFAVDRAALEEEVQSAQTIVQDELKKRGVSILDQFNNSLSETGLDLQVDIIPSKESFAKSQELFNFIEQKTKELENLDPSESFKGPEIIAQIQAAQNELFNSLATTEQQLESISDLVGGIPDINAALAMDPALIAQVIAYANELRALLALLRGGLAGVGPGAAALQSPVGSRGPGEQAAAKKSQLENSIRNILAPEPKTAPNGAGIPKVKKGGGGGGGGKEDAKTWWEEFQAGLKELDLTIDSDILAGLQVSTIKELTTLSGKYKAAQEALNKSAMGEVELRRKSLDLMKQARQEAIAALNDGSVGGATAALESAGVQFDEGMIGRLNAASVAYTTQLALRIQQLELERNTMALGSQAAVAATNAISSMKLELESMTSSSKVMRDAFNSGLQSFLKGQSTFKEFAEGVLDTFTNTIIEKFSTSFTDSLFNSLGLDNLFGKLFGGASKLGGGLGGGLGGALQPGSTPANPLWTTSKDNLLAGIGGLGGKGGGKGGGGIFGFILSLFGGGFAEGGQVSGPGTGTSDSILARLSTGEFVVNAKSAKQWLPMLEQINSGRMPAFASGGMVGPKNSKSFKSALGGQKSQQVFQINVTGDITNQTRKEIISMLPEISAGVNMVNRERGSR